MSGAGKRQPGVLRGIRIFADLDDRQLEELERELEFVNVTGGEIFMREGEPGDSLAIIVHGRVRVFRSGPEGETPVRELGHGEVLGEMSLLVSQPRFASVRAVRDSIVARLRADVFHRFALRRPEVLLRVSQVLVERLAPSRQDGQSVQAISVVPAGPHGSDFVERLVRALEAFAPARHLSAAIVDRELGGGAAQTPPDGARNTDLVTWLHAQEREFGFVVYETEPTLTPWTRRCLRQSDLVLSVAGAGSAPEPGEIEQAIAGTPPAALARHELVLLHDGERPTGTAEWLTRRPVRAHHHVRRGNQGDHERVARIVTGRGIGLALGGGGPRGFAHLGVMRALDEAGIPVDMVGGTSIGSIMGGFLAMGLGGEERMALAIEGFIETRFLIGVTFPTVSVSSSRTLTRLLRAPGFFGDRQIEDFWLPYFCVSANITRAQPVIHDRGAAWRAVRASIAIPGILPPVCDGGDLLVDGGVVDNLPVDVMRARLGGGRVIAVDLEPEVEMAAEEDFEPTISGWHVLGRKMNPFRPSRKVPSLIGVMMRARGVAGIRAQRDILASAGVDLYVRPALGTYGALDFKPGREIAEAGYRSACEALEKTPLAVPGRNDP